MLRNSEGWKRGVAKYARTIVQGYLRHLANFAEIARSGALGAAAERLGMSVSGLSRSLAILEAHYGFLLVLRGAKGVTLTEQGRLVLAEAEVLVGAAHRALEVGRAPMALSGKVVFSAPKEVLQFWTVEMLAEVLAAYPGLELTVLASDQVLDTRRQRVDVVLRIGRPGPAVDLDPVLEAEVHPVLVAPPEVVARIGEVGDGPLPVTFLRFGPFGQDGMLTLPSLTPGGAPREVRFARQVLVSDVAVAVALARAGAGVVGCLEPTVQEDLAEGRLLGAFPGHGFPAAQLRLGLTRGHQSHAAIAFAEALAGRLAALRVVKGSSDPARGGYASPGRRTASP